jgi:DNA topoisomerase IA
VNAASLAAVLEEDALKLYTLIWARTMACQLEQAILSQVAIDIVDDTDNVQLRSNGSSVSFPGYLAVLEVALGIFSVSTEGHLARIECKVGTEN